MVEMSALEKPKSPAAKTPEHQTVYTAIRERILYGEFAPGAALTIQGLQALTGAGMTPVREALRRLTSEGAIEMLGNRRLCVPVLSRANIDELFFMRKMLEPELARRAAQNVTDADIGMLRKTDADLNTAIEQGDVHGYLRHNYTFHKRFYEKADAPIIEDTVDRLWLRFGPSLRANCGRAGTDNLPDQHADLLEALEARDVFGAARAIGDDVMQGMNLYLAGADSVDGA